MSLKSLKFSNSFFLFCVGDKKTIEIIKVLEDTQRNFLLGKFIFITFQKERLDLN